MQKWLQMPAFGGRAALSRRPAVVGAFVGTIAEMPKIPMISMADGGHIVRHPPPAPRSPARGSEGVTKEMLFRARDEGVTKEMLFRARGPLNTT